VRPDAYLIVAAGQRLHAPTLEELAEIAESQRVMRSSGCGGAVGKAGARLAARRFGASFAC
jgi:hypothetical protein